MTNVEGQEYVQVNETPKTTEMFVSPEISEKDAMDIQEFLNLYANSTEEQKDAYKNTFNNLLYNEGLNFNNAEILEKSVQDVHTLEKVMNEYPNVSESDFNALKKVATSSLENSVKENETLHKIVDSDQYEK